MNASPRPLLVALVLGMVLFALWQGDGYRVLSSLARLVGVLS